MFHYIFNNDQVQTLAVNLIYAQGTILILES